MQGLSCVIPFNINGNCVAKPTHAAMKICTYDLKKKIHKRKQIQVKASLCCALLLLIIQYVRLVHNNCNVCNKHAATPKPLIKDVKERREGLPLW